MTISILLVLISVSASQLEHRPGFSVHLSRTNVETGFTYDPEPIMTAAIACDAYNYGALVDWGDGSPPEILSTPVSDGQNVRMAAGTYPYVWRSQAHARWLIRCFGQVLS